MKQQPKSRRPARRSTDFTTWSTVLAGVVLSAIVCAEGLMWQRQVSSWLLYTSLVPLFAAIRYLSPRPAFLVGACWGTSMVAWAAFVIGGLDVSTSRYSAAALAIIPGVYTAIGSLLSRRIGFSPLLLATAWMGLEASLRAVGLGVPVPASSPTPLPIEHVGYLFIGFAAAFLSAQIVAAIEHLPRSLSILRVCVSDIHVRLEHTWAMLTSSDHTSRFVCGHGARAPPHNAI